MTPLAADSNAYYYADIIASDINAVLVQCPEGLADYLHGVACISYEGTESTLRFLIENALSRREGFTPITAWRRTQNAVSRAWVVGDDEDAVYLLLVEGDGPRELFVYVTASSDEPTSE